MKKYILILAFITLSAIFFGCVGPAGENASEPDASPSTAPVQETPVSGSLTRQDEYDITNMVLESARIMVDNFSSPQEIAVYDMTRFLYTRMQEDGITAAYDRPANSSSVNVPISAVREYAEVYFGLSEVRVDFFSQQYFDGQFITIPDPALVKEAPLYELEVEDFKVGRERITVSLLMSSGGVDYERLIYTLKLDREGVVSFVSKSGVPVEFGLYAINGAQAEITELIGVPVNSRTAKSFKFAPFGDDMLVWLESGRSLRLGVLDLETYKSSQFITLEAMGQGEAEFQVQAVGKNVFVYRRGRVTVLDQSLATQNAIIYPDDLTAQFDSYTDMLSLSPDGGVLAFSNLEGLQYYSFARNSTQLVLSHPENTDKMRDTPEQTWQPVSAFDAETGYLLLGARQRQGISSFAVCDAQSNYRLIQIAGGSDMLYTSKGDKLTVFGPSMVRREPMLPNTLTEYNTKTGNINTITMRETRDEGDDGSVLLSHDRVYRTEMLSVGADLVDSFTVRGFDARSTSGNLLDFGYVDRKARLLLRETGENGSVIAVCSGMFINRIVVIQP